MFTAAQILTRVLGVDGAGSGLDADLLDGQQGSWYADVAARLGYTPANQAGDTFSGPIRRDARFYLDMLASNPVLQFDNNDYLRYDRANNDLGLVIAGTLHRIMHMGNDGAGSGFDADMLDGQHSSAFLQASMFTAAQILTHLLTVDGAGSGLDADLLGGQPATYYQAVEVGSLAFFPFSPIPSTYLLCDGSAVSRTTEARLFARIGTTYGVGNGTTTFNLPDYRGEFLRGWDNGRGVDAGRTLGSHQMDAMQDLKGRIAGMGRGNFAATGNTGVFGGQGQGTASHSDGTNITARANLDFDASLVARTAEETRPRNISVAIGIRR